MHRANKETVGGSLFSTKKDGFSLSRKLGGTGMGILPTQQNETATPIANTVPSTVITGEIGKTFKDKLIKASSVEVTYDKLGNPRGEGSIVPKTYKVTPYYHSDEVSFVNLDFFSNWLYYIFMVVLTICGMVTLWSEADFNMRHFFLATSILGAVIFFLATVTLVRHIQQFRQFSKKHNQSIFAPWLVMTGYLLIAWLGALTWTKEYSNSHVNRHAPTQLNRYYVVFAIYIVGSLISTPFMGSFTISHLYPERTSPDHVIFANLKKGGVQFQGAYQKQESEVLFSEAIHEVLERSKQKEAGA